MSVGLSVWLCGVLCVVCCEVFGGREFDWSASWHLERLEWMSVDSCEDWMVRWLSAKRPTSEERKKGVVIACGCVGNP